MKGVVVSSWPQPLLFFSHTIPSSQSQISVKTHQHRPTNTPFICLSSSSPSGFSSVVEQQQEDSLPLPSSPSAADFAADNVDPDALPLSKMDRRSGNSQQNSQSSRPTPPPENYYPQYGSYYDYNANYYHNPSQTSNPQYFPQPNHPTFVPPPSGSFIGMLTEDGNDTIRLGSQSQPFVVEDVGNEHNRNEAAPSRPRRARKGAAEWTNKEDEIVISAWLNVSKDPIVGTGQKQDTFENRLYQYFCEAKANRPDVDWPEGRTPSTMKARWKRIRVPVTEFCCAYASVVRRNPSGCSEADYINQAKETYKALHQGKTFTLDKCWQLLRHEEKWKMHVIEEEQKTQRSTKRTKNTASGAYTSSGSNSHCVRIDEDEEEQHQTPTSRPLGRDASKRKAKGVGKASSSESFAPPDVVLEQMNSMSTHDDKKVEALAKLAELRAQQLEEQRNYNNLKQRELDMQTVNMDLSQI